MIGGRKYNPITLSRHFTVHLLVINSVRLDQGEKPIRADWQNFSLLAFLAEQYLSKRQGDDEIGGLNTLAHETPVPNTKALLTLTHDYRSPSYQSHSEIGSPLQIMNIARSSWL